MIIHQILNILLFVAMVLEEIDKVPETISDIKKLRTYPKPTSAKVFIAIIILNTICHIVVLFAFIIVLLQSTFLSMAISLLLLAVILTTKHLISKNKQQSNKNKKVIKLGEYNDI
jgi:hypothetical protein